MKERYIIKGPLVIIFGKELFLSKAVILVFGDLEIKIVEIEKSIGGIKKMKTCK